MPFNWRSPKCPSVFSWEDLKKIPTPSECGRIIHLKHAPTTANALKQLKSVMAESKLEQIILIGCFSETEDMREVLEALRKNKLSKKLHLNLHWNVYDDNCISILTDLLYSGIVRSLEFPDNMDAVNAERLLEVIHKVEDLEMKKLNLNGAVLNKHSLKYIEEILKIRKVKEYFNMSNCMRTKEASLTEENYKTLKKAAGQGNRWYKKNLQIEWFSYVGDIDVKHFSKFTLMFNNTTEHLFNSETMTKFSSIQEVVRLNANMAWQLLKPGSKRSRNQIKTNSASTAEKRQKINLESSVDALVDMIETQFEVGANPPENKADKEIDGVAENNSPHNRWFESHPSTSSEIQQMPPQAEVPQTTDQQLNRVPDTPRQIVYNIQNFNAKNVNTGQVSDGGAMNVGDSSQLTLTPRSSVSSSGGINVGNHSQGTITPRSSVSDYRASENHPVNELRSPEGDDNNRPSTSRTIPR
ncbi:uncharacterized protein LOC144432181 [Styela clava]